MATLRMGFCGGCLSHQPDIPVHQLFHRVLSTWLTDQAGHRLQVTVSRGFSRPTPERINELLTCPVDFVLLQARWLPAVTNSRWIDKQIEGRQASLRLNRRFWPAEHLPILARLKWQVPVRRRPMPPPTIDDPEETYARGSLAAGVNVAAGLLFGVAARARQEAARDVLQGLDLLCASGIPFFLMGAPPIRRSGLAGYRIGLDLNRSLRSTARNRGVAYVDLFEGWKPGFLQADGLHATSLGHRFVAQRLQQEIGDGLLALGEAAGGSRRR